ncbi:MAG: tRNA-modifying protein YgfZ [Ignavibacteria bacterium]|nr:tRNA-modifying protein YgfZ [Ignavibacteria bacterium]
MFVENYVFTSMVETLKKYFPNISVNGNSIKYYSSIEDEYNTIRYGAGLYLSNRNILKLTGKDVLDFIHRISSNAVLELKPNHQLNTLFLNEKGRFIDRSNLIHLGDYFLLVGSLNEFNKLYNWINKFIITEDIQINNISNDFTIIDVFGPQSESYLTLLFGDDLKLLNGNNVLNLTINQTEILLHSRHITKTLPNYRVIIPRNDSSALLEYMINNKSVFDVNLIGENAFNIYRIEQGIPLAPNEINDELNPHENSLIYEVDFKKGCYIGQEVIARLDTYNKIQKELVGLKVTEKVDTKKQYAIVTANGDEAGIVSSLHSESFLNYTLGLGFLRKNYSEKEIQFFIKDEQELIPIEIKTIPIKA